MRKVKIRGFILITCFVIRGLIGTDLYSQGTVIDLTARKDFRPELSNHNVTNSVFVQTQSGKHCFYNLGGKVELEGSRNHLLVIVNITLGIESKRLLNRYTSNNLEFNGDGEYQDLFIAKFDINDTLIVLESTANLNLDTNSKEAEKLVFIIDSLMTIDEDDISVNYQLANEILHYSFLQAFEQPLIRYKYEALWERLLPILGPEDGEMVIVFKEILRQIKSVKIMDSCEF